MKRLTIQLPPVAPGIESWTESCGMCGRKNEVTAELGLMLMDGHRPVCHDCGAKQDPRLSALLDLARVAQRVGHINRHTLVPSLGALLELARAAENYSNSTQPLRRKAS